MAKVTSFILKIIVLVIPIIWLLTMEHADSRGTVGHGEQIVW